MANGVLPADAAASAFQPAELRDWFTLLKPRVVSLVLFTGLVGMMVAPGAIGPVEAVAAILSIAVAAGASGAVNMWYDRDIDALMRRTAQRPVACGRILASDAVAFGIVLSAASVLVMYLATNAVAAALLAASILFYTLVYTVWLKRRTPQNIVIGGAAGAFPPVIGWAAVTGDVTLYPILLFLIIFLWTPPHFWSLALYAHSDYQRAGVPMLPVAAGARATRWQILLYSVILFGVSLLPWSMGLAGPIYGFAALLLGLGFVALSLAALTESQDETGRSLVGDRAARRNFRYSLLYLFLLFVCVAGDRLASWHG